MKVLPRRFRELRSTLRPKQVLTVVDRLVSAIVLVALLISIVILGVVSAVCAVVENGINNRKK